MALQACNEHFGIRENAFAITPDPRYVFLSDRHREALAHLLYGVEEGGGFVQLTGEVGTGKTTICRVFLEELPEQVDVALLLQPPESGRDLLQALALELGIELGDGTLREQVQRLFGHLLHAHGAGRRTVVILDEAQNIRPAVLEQLRMLTNLETPSHKLLQVFLIGQPELRDLLARPELLQVSQRVTTRYHLQPLSADETAAYVRHRLGRAGAPPELFTDKALQRVHRESGGVPRVINILCDRALLGAFAVDRMQVDETLVARAAREWRGQAEPAVRPRARWPKPLLAMAAGGLVTLAVLVAGRALWQTLTPSGAVMAQQPSVAPEAPAAEAKLAAVATADEEMTGGNTVDERTAVETDRPATLALLEEAVPAAGTSVPAPTATGLQPAEEALLAEWKVSVSGGGAFCERVESAGLRCMAGRGLRTLQRMDRPALVSLRGENDQVQQVALLEFARHRAFLAAGERRWSLSRTELQHRWNGRFTVLWRPPFEGGTMLGEGVVGPRVAWLQRALDRIEGRRHRAADPVYDADLAARVRRFQEREGLTVDGVAGPLTLMHINARLGSPPVPTLRASG